MRLHFIIVLIGSVSIYMNAMKPSSISSDSEKKKLEITIPCVFLKELSEKSNLLILDQMPIKSDGIDLKKILQGINSLAQTNNFLNTFINDKKRTLQWIKELSWQFRISNLDVAAKLCTKAARKRFIVQNISLNQCSKGNFNIYCKQGFDLEFTYDSKQRTALMGKAYCSEGQPMASMLIKKGADVNARDTQNKNSFMLHAEKANWPFICELLRSDDLLVDDQDNDGNTALHYCIMGTLRPAYKSIFIQAAHQLEPAFVAINALLAKGANPSIKNNENMTPLEYVKHIQDSYNDSNRLFGPKLSNSEIIRTLQKSENDWRKYA